MGNVKRQKAIVKTAENEITEIEAIEGELLLADDVGTGADGTKTIPTAGQPVEFGIQEQSLEVFKKSHELIFSRQRLTSHEQNVFNLMIAHMKESHWSQPGGPTYEFPSPKLSEWFDIESQHLSTTLSPVADRLAKRTVGFANPETGEWDYMPIISRISYKKGKLLIIPNPQLKEQYIDYSKSGFALINRRPLYKLKKIYSKRLYEILSRFKQEGFKQRPLTVTELQGYFGLLDEKGLISEESKSLASTGVFIKRCISEPLEEIAKVCAHELIFFKHDGKRLGYSLIRQGTTTVGVKFHYRWIDNKITMSEEAAKDTIKDLETRRLIKKERLSDDDLKFLAEAYLTLGDADSSKLIYEVIEKREAEANSKVDKKITKEEEEKAAFFDKIRQMKEQFGGVSY